MGLKVRSSGKVEFTALTDALRVEGVAGHAMAVKKKSYDFSLVLAANNQENQSGLIVAASGTFPAGCVFLGATANVLEAITTTGTPTTIDVQTAGTSTTPLVTFAVTSNAVATSVVGTRANSPLLSAAAAGVFIGFTGGTTPAVTAGKIRITVYYLEFPTA